jgi:hypothetical protein
LLKAQLRFLSRRSLRDKWRQRCHGAESKMALQATGAHPANPLALIGQGK